MCLFVYLKRKKGDFEMKKNRILSLLVTLAMIIGLLAAFPAVSYAAGDYYDISGTVRLSTIPEGADVTFKSDTKIVVDCNRTLSSINAELEKSYGLFRKAPKLTIVDDGTPFYGHPEDMYTLRVVAHGMAIHVGELDAKGYFNLYAEGVLGGIHAARGMNIACLTATVDGGEYYALLSGDYSFQEGDFGSETYRVENDNPWKTIKLDGNVHLLSEDTALKAKTLYNYGYLYAESGKAAIDVDYLYNEGGMIYLDSQRDGITNTRFKNELVPCAWLYIFNKGYLYINANVSGIVARGRDQVGYIELTNEDDGMLSIHSGYSAIHCQSLGASQCRFPKIMGNATATIAPDAIHSIQYPCYNEESDVYHDGNTLGDENGDVVKDLIMGDPTYGRNVMGSITLKKTDYVSVGDKLEVSGSNYNNVLFTSYYGAKLVKTISGLCGNAGRIHRLNPDHIFNLIRDTVRIRARQIDLVDHRKHLQIVINR